MYIFPVSISTGSEKVNSISLLTAIFAASSAGAELLRVGGSISAEVKFREVLSDIPAKELPDSSSKAEESICT